MILKKIRIIKDTNGLPVEKVMLSKKSLYIVFHFENLKFIDMINEVFPNSEVKHYSISSKLLDIINKCEVITDEVLKDDFIYLSEFKKELLDSGLGIKISDLSILLFGIQYLENSMEEDIIIDELNKVSAMTLEENVEINKIDEMSEKYLEEFCALEGNVNGNDIEIIIDTNNLITEISFKGEFNATLKIDKPFSDFKMINNVLKEEVVLVIEKLFNDFKAKNNKLSVDTIDGKLDNILSLFSEMSKQNEIQKKYLKNKIIEMENKITELSRRIK